MSISTDCKFGQALALGLIAIFTASGLAQAERYELDFDVASPSLYLDRWIYPFNVSPGTRIQAPTFGAVGSEDVDERDGQLLIAINAQELGIPADLPPASYEIESARLLIFETVGGYSFDGTYDRFTTYLDSSSEQMETDSDAGRPIELYGASFRNDFEEFGWPDGGTSTPPPVYSAGSPFGTSGRATRNVFPVDALGNDVSNNIDSLNGGALGFDPRPLSVAQALDANDQPIAPGTIVSPGTQFAFDIDVADPAIQNYLRQGLSKGQLGLIVTSLHDAGLQGVDDPYPNWATSDHFSVPGPRFELTLRIVEPQLPGDFDGSGTLDVADVDLLMRGIGEGSNDPSLDTNRDAVVNLTDLEVWLHDWFGTYFGDANLDGQFNTVDLVEVLAAGEYEDAVVGNSRWSTGDWNADGEFTSSDLVSALADGGYEQGPRAAVSVPEPSAGALTLLVGAMLAARMRPGRRHRDGTLLY